ncbi:hypothetical protein [Chondromyces apiculatus]|uniref:hypothetical protein n=1 Tax=Chondromyces apiculatus TaxID=51 RepID=UPI0018CC3576|nr:hypothetical protein [Chondromyces apiculatus]
MIEGEPNLVQIVQCDDRVCGTSKVGTTTALRRSNNDGNAMEALLAPPGCDATRIASDTQNLYWIDAANRRFSRLLLNETPFEEIVIEDFFTEGNSLRDVVVRSNGVYLAVDNEVRLYPLAGGMPTTVYPTTGTTPSRIAVDGNDICWIDTTDGNVKCHGSPLSISTTTGLAAIAIDSSRVFWAEANEIHRMNVAGTGRLTIARGQQTPSSIAVSSGWVYWTNNRQGGGEIMRVKADCGCE